MPGVVTVCNNDSTLEVWLMNFRTGEDFNSREDPLKLSNSFGDTLSVSFNLYSSDEFFFTTHPKCTFGYSVVLKLLI